LNSLNWQHLSPEERNLAFNNRAHVGAGFATQINERWAADSALLRQQRPEHLNLEYRAGDRTRWDFYPAHDPRAPCCVHIHGGFWQRGSRESFACMAQGILARGWSAAFAGYTLAPQASLSQIVDELHSALDWFANNAGKHGIEGSLILTGWSAGGHLTACLIDHPAVTAGLAISGVFDLAPLRDAPHVNDLVQLSVDEINRFSPIRLTPSAKKLSIAYGTGELPAMVGTSRAFNAHRAAAHCPGDLIPIPAANHFTILDQLLDKDSHLVRSIVGLAPAYSSTSGTQG
jgi:acetyl esterase/lipase